MIITISDMWKNQQKMLDNDNQIKLSSLIVFLDKRSRVKWSIRRAISSTTEQIEMSFGIIIMMMAPDLSTAIMSKGFQVTWSISG